MAEPASAEFWQLFLAAELPSPRARTLLRELGRMEDPVSALKKGHGLSVAERARVDAVDMVAFERAIKGGVQLVASADLPTFAGADDMIPPRLFASGNAAALHCPTIGIVGTRGATTYGKAVAAKFAEAFARAGVTVVSGGALGIDAAAHRGALEVQGRTVAVLAGGIDRIYPAVHAGLFRQIQVDGCLVTRFCVGSAPNAYKFLVRNSVVAALSRAVVVIEAPARSGALSTAHAANDLGRQVFVVPANIDNLNFRGSHALIRDGATLVDHPDQILEALDIAIAPERPAAPPAGILGEKILSVLSVDPLAAEFISERTGMPTHEVLSELTILELEGRVIRDSGGYALRP